jgi:hypothetical protein
LKGKKAKDKTAASFKYVPGAWRSKHDKKQAPGDYEVMRLFTVSEDKTKGNKKLGNLPTFERPVYGLIQKQHESKRATEKTEGKLGPTSYFKELTDLNKSFKVTSKPMRKY